MEIRRRSPTPLAALALVLCQCGTAEPSLRRVIAIQPGDQVRVVHTDLRAGVTIGLQNPAMGSRSEIYSRGGNPTYKVIGQEELQLLLDVLAEQGFFDRAHANELPEARDLLVVQSNDRDWVWSRRPLGVDDASSIEAFQRCVTYVRALYNTTTAYYSRSGMTGEDFERESKQIELRSQETIQNIKGQDPQGRKNPPK